MDLIFYVEEDTLIAAMSGEIDHHVAEKLRKDIDAEIAMCGTRDLVFDFGKVDFMDSSGIGMVLGRYKKVHGNGGRVTIRNAGRLVKQILDMSGVFTLMEYEDVEIREKGGRDEEELYQSRV